MKRFSLLLTALATLVACIKNDPNLINPDVPDSKPDKPSLEIPEGISLKYKLRESTVFFSKEEASSLKVIDDTHIMVSGSKIPLVGQIILCASSSQIPAGFLGKVVYVSGAKSSDAILTIEPVSLEEAFEELEIHGFVDLADYIDTLEDEEGNILKVDKSESNNEVWETLDNGESEEGNEEENKNETKAPSVFAKTFSVNFNSKFIEGKLYSQTRSEVNIVLKKGEPMKCTMVFNEKTGLDGTLKIKSKDPNGDYPLLKMPPLHVPLGPVVLNPQLTFHAGYSLKGENYIKGDIKAVLSNTETTISNLSGEYKTTSRNLGKSFDMSISLWESKGLVSLWVETALRYSVMNEAILSFGLGVRPHYTFEGSVSFDISTKNLLSVNPTITKTIGVDAFAYVYSNLFKQNCEKYEVSIPVWSYSGEFSLLTSFNGTSVKFQPDLIVVSPNCRSKDTIMKETEKGIALFKKGSDTPVAKKPIKISENTKADNNPDAVEDIFFENVGNSSDYEVKAYVTTNEGVDYYKPITRKLITEIRLYPMSWSLNYTYDKNGNVNWMRYKDGVSGGVRITQSSISWAGAEYCTIDSDGCISSFSTDHEYWESYTSSDGHVVSSSTPGYSFNYRWNDGNYITTGYGGEFCHYSYTDYLDKSNINIMAALKMLIDEVGYIIPSFECGMIHTIAPGIKSKNLPSGMSSRIGHVSFSYDFDDEGYITSMSAAAAYFEGSVWLSFEYE